MGNNWPVLPLEKIAKVIDSRHKTPQYSDIGYPMVRVVDVKGGELSLTDTKNVTSDVYADFSKGRDPEIGDLIISRVGSYGNVSYVSSKQKFCLGQNTALIIPKDNDRFLYYALVSPQLRQQIDNMAVGAVQKTISLKSIRGLEIPQPPAQERAEIANFLSSLDDKITLNRQINQTLEQMAQALFKSWFVDFDPVVDNALDAGFFEQDLAFPDELLCRADARRTVREQGDVKQLPDAIRQLFPAAFEECAEPSVGLGGWVPKGWVANSIGGVSKLVKGKSYKSSELASSDTALVTLKSFQRGGGYRLDGLKPYIGSYKKEQEVSAGDLIIAFTDVTQAADIIGKPAIVISDPCYKKLVISLDVSAVRPNKVSLKYYLYGVAKTLEFQSHTYAHSTGTTVLHLSKNAVPDFIFSSPSDSILERYHEMVSPFFDVIEKNNCSLRTLANLRDTLLPKLISGELCLDNIAADLANEGSA